MFVCFDVVCSFVCFVFVLVSCVCCFLVLCLFWCGMFVICYVFVCLFYRVFIVCLFWCRLCPCFVTICLGVYETFGFR